MLAEFDHATYTAFPNTAIAGFSELPGLLLILSGTVKLFPAFVIFTKRISLLPEVLSDHTTYTAFPDTAIAGFSELPGLLLIFSGTVKLFPAFVLFTKSISLLSGVISDLKFWILLSIS